MSATPQRITLRRTRGWRLQRTSRALNGLAAVRVARPGPWGNPQPVQHGITAAQACQTFKEYARDMLELDPDWLEPLRGKNLACWCKSEPCHATVLLKLANRKRK